MIISFVRIDKETISKVINIHDKVCRKYRSLLNSGYNELNGSAWNLAITEITAEDQYYIKLDTKIASRGRLGN